MKKSIIAFLTTIVIVGCGRTHGEWDGSYWIAMESNHANTMKDGEKYFHYGTPDDTLWADLGKYILPQFRKEFECDGQIAGATVRICGLGQFDLFVNGQKVGDHFMDPAWTQYDREAAYVTFDIGNMLDRENAIGVMLGGGFYNIPNERYHKIVGSMGAPMMRLVLDIEYTDGRTRRICSDSTWKVAPSPVTFSSIYGGEDFDATLLSPGWNKAGFDDSRWNNVIIADSDPQMFEQKNDPLIIHSELRPVAVVKKEQGWLYDMGQNFSGIFRIKVSGERGTKVIITPAEILKDGAVDQSSSGGPCRYCYTLSGDGIETWQPQFTYYGQRYFFVEGLQPVELVGLHTTASSREVGSFECSNQLFNRILEMTKWALRNNMASVLTDCPHREKLGWNEQMHLMFASDGYCHDLLNIYRNELDRMESAQREDGCIPTIAPEYVRFADGFEDSPEWGSSIVLVPWYIYKWYGDSTEIIRHYPAMKRHMDYLRSKKDERGVVAYGLRDWLSTDPVDPAGITSHLIYIHCLDAMSKMSQLQGFTEDSEYYTAERSLAEKDFNSAFWDGSTYGNGCQAAAAMALYMDVVPEEYQQNVYEGLLDSIEKREYAIGVGEVAHPYLLNVLSSHKDDGTIFKIHTQRKAPGYAWCIDHGATALPEAWDGGMSQTHFCLGHIVEWFYGTLAGIRQADGDRGWKSVIIEPRPVGDLTWVKCSFDSPSGTIACDWKLQDDGKFVLHVTVPENMEVDVRLPEKYNSSYYLERK